MKKLLFAFLLTLFTATTASATLLIKEVMVIGGPDDSALNNIKSELSAQGWNDTCYDLNKGCGGNSDYIYLLYLPENNTSGINNGYITDFFFSNTYSESIDYQGRTYYPAPVMGSNDFVESHGDLNNNANGAYIYLYYTKGTFSDNRVVNNIYFNDYQDGAVCLKGEASGYDLNKGCGSGTPYIYMHLDMGTATLNHSPISSLGACQGGVHKITVSGWAYDPNASSESIGVQVYVYKADGTTLYKTQALTANMARTDVNSSQNITGNHGFSADISIHDAGSYKVKVFAIDYNSGDNHQIGSTTTVTVTGTKPTGHLDVCQGNNDKITVSGWAYDPDEPSESINVHIYVYKSDGTTLYMPVQAITANKPRSDVNTTYGITGNHGFSTDVNIAVSGTYKVKVYAIDTGGDGNLQIGSTTTVSVTVNTSEVTIGDGDTYGVFMYKYLLLNQIYLAEEIGTAGTISAIAFNLHNNGFDAEHLKVYMKHTDKNVFTSDNDIVPVYESENVFDGYVESETSGWLTINLDAPFEYDGISNLLICCYYPDGRKKDVMFYRHIHTYGSYIASDNNIVPALDGSNFNSLYKNGRYSQRYNIQLTIKAEGFPKPDNLIVSSSTQNSATLAWTAPTTQSTITGYSYQYKMKNDEAWSSEVQTTATSVNISGLEVGKDYDFRVKALYGENTSVYAVLHFTPVPKPTNFYVGNNTVNSLTLTWTAPEGQVPTGYVYQYKKTNDGSWSSEISTTETTVTISGLTSNTDYKFQIKAKYGNSYSLWVSAQAYTLCGIPYDCGFEDGMDNWSMVDCNIDYSADIYYNPYTGLRVRAKHDGDVGFQFYNYYDNIKPQYLISPCFEGDKEMLVSFYYKPELRVQAETFCVGYSTTTSDVNAFIWGDEVTADEENWEKYEQSFPAGTRYIAVKYITNVYRLYLDDFHFEEYSSYAKPSGLAATSLTNQGATLAWTAPGNASPTGYAYQFKKITDTSWSNEATVNGTSVTLSNLPSNTTYDFRLKAVYTGNNASNFVTLRFITEGNAMTDTFIHTFEDGMGGWRVVDAYGNTGLSSSYPNSGNNGFMFDCSSDHPQYLISPLINIDGITGLYFFFRCYHDDNTSYTSGFRVGFSTTTKDIDAFTWFEEKRSEGYWQVAEQWLPANVNYYAIQWTGGYNLYIDDIYVTKYIETKIATKAIFNGQEKYVTTFFKRNVYMLQEGAEAYTVVRDGSELVFLRIGDGDSRYIPANTPVVIVADKTPLDTSDTKELSLTVTSVNNEIVVRPGNILLGVETDTAVTGGKIDGKDVYVLGINNGVAGFFKFTGNTIPAGKAYYLK